LEVWMDEKATPYRGDCGDASRALVFSAEIELT
jgi:hypothetical protein